MPSEASYARVEIRLIREPAHPRRTHIDAGQLGELADSMATEGLHQPIGLRGPFPDQTYEVVWGHRRLLAARSLGWRFIDARVHGEDFDPLLAAVSENLQRTDLTPMEEATALDDFLSRGCALAEVARLFRRSPAWVRARLELLDYPPDVQAGVHTGNVGLAVARALATVDSDDYRKELLGEAARTGASEATAQLWAAHYQANKELLARQAISDADLRESRDAFSIKYECPACARDVDIADTRLFRFCITCAHEIEKNLTAPAPPRA